jgi:hypothetical protein
VRGLPKGVSPKAHDFCRSLRLEGICRKECEQRVYPLVQSTASPSTPVGRELNDVWFLCVPRARLSRLGERRQEAIRVHRPPPLGWRDRCAIKHGRSTGDLDRRQTIWLKDRSFNRSSLSRSLRLCRDISEGGARSQAGGRDPCRDVRTGGRLHPAASDQDHRRGRKAVSWRPGNRARRPALDARNGQRPRRRPKGHAQVTDLKAARADPASVALSRGRIAG